MEFSKIFGWIFLFLGLLLIFCSLYSSYQIFTGKKQAPELFFGKKEAQREIRVSIPGIEKGVEVPISEQIQKVLSSRFFPPKILNLMAWSMWAWILILGGGKISSFGIKLIK